MHVLKETVTEQKHKRVTKCTQNNSVYTFKHGNYVSQFLKLVTKYWEGLIKTVSTAFILLR